MTAMVAVPVITTVLTCCTGIASGTSLPASDNLSSWAVRTAGLPTLRLSRAPRAVCAPGVSFGAGVPAGATVAAAGSIPSVLELTFRTLHTGSLTRGGLELATLTATTPPLLCALLVLTTRARVTGVGSTSPATTGHETILTSRAVRTGFSNTTCIDRLLAIGTVAAPATAGGGGVATLGAYFAVSSR